MTRPYRDGVSSVIEGWHADVTRAKRRRASLASELGLLPGTARRQLTALERELERTPQTIAELEAGESALREYLETLDAAVAAAEPILEHRHRTRYRRLLRAAAIALLAGGAVFLAVATVVRYRTDASACASGSECRELGHCSYPYIAALLPEPECFARDERDCAASCRDFGRCRHVIDTCMVDRVEHCKASTRCRELGECIWRPVATLDVVHNPRNTCAIGFDECRASEGCRREGRCAVRGEACTVAREDDCLASTACLEEGRCTARDGACVRDPG
jgi:hypothetical protein